MTRGVGPRGPGGRPIYGGGGYDRRPPAPRGPPVRRSGYRVIISGLPASGSWQDLKVSVAAFAATLCFPCSKVCSFTKVGVFYRLSTERGEERSSAVGDNYRRREGMKGE